MAATAPQADIVPVQQLEALGVTPTEMARQPRDAHIRGAS
jgi:hypothetical protein